MSEGTKALPPGTEYFYARAKFAHADKYLLKRNECATRLDEDGTLDMIFFKYARDHEEAKNLVAVLEQWEETLRGLRAATERFLETFEFKAPVE